MQQLAAARRAGQGFEEAWPVALAAAVQAADPGERRGWPEAFRATMESWQGAWERRPAPRCERVLQAVAEDPERVACSERECEGCGGEIPEGRGRKGAPARYCSDGCRKRASYARAAA